MHKQLLLAAAIIVAASLLAMPLAHDVDAQKGKDKKPRSCNNVKIQVNVNGVEENQTVLGVVTIDDRTASKMGTVEVNETSITLPFNFKKIDCPVIGAMYHGFVNGTHFEGEVKSLKKPNKVTVDL